MVVALNATPRCCSFELPASGDVHRDADGALPCAGRVGEGIAAVFDPAQRAIGALDAVFDAILLAEGELFAGGEHERAILRHDGRGPLGRLHVEFGSRAAPDLFVGRADI